MVKSFKCSETKRVFYREISRKFPHDIQRNAMKKLWMIDAVPDIHSLHVFPPNRPETFRGNHYGHQGVRINSHWMISFRWKAGAARDVEIIDSH